MNRKQKQRSGKRLTGSVEPFMVDRILHRLYDRPWGNLITHLRFQYESIEFSVKFVCEYLTELCSGRLPRKLDIPVLEKARQYDPTIVNYYNNLKDGSDQYTLNTRQNRSISSINQECATYISCARYQ